MSGLKAAQIHEWPFRAVKGPMQPLAALDSPFTLRLKDLIFPSLIKSDGKTCDPGYGIIFLGIIYKWHTRYTKLNKKI